MMSRFFAHLVIAVVTGFFMITSTKAGSIEITQKLDKNNITAGASIKVKDPFFQSNYSSANYKTKVSLVYGRENRTDLEGQTFQELSVNYTLTFYDENYTQLGI